MTGFFIAANRALGLMSLCLVLSAGGARAGESVWQPSPGRTQVPLWPGVAIVVFPGGGYIELAIDLEGTAAAPVRIRGVVA